MRFWRRLLDGTLVVAVTPGADMVVVVVGSTGLIQQLASKGSTTSNNMVSF